MRSKFLLLFLGFSFGNLLEAKKFLCLLTLSKEDSTYFRFSNPHDRNLGVRISTRAGSHPDTELLIMDFYPNSRQTKGLSDPAKIEESFEEFIAFVKNNYLERRGEGTRHQWSNEFISKLRKDFIEAVQKGETKLIIARNKNTQEIQGTIRLINAKSGGRTPGYLKAELPVSTYLGLNIQIPSSPYVEVNLFDPLIASMEPEMNKAPGIPSHLLGRDPDSGGPAYYGSVFEPSSFVVSNELPEDIKAAVRTDLWLSYTHEVTQNQRVPYYAQFGNHFVSYADPASLRMYRKIGWLPLHEVAEKYGIRNGNDPHGKFPAEPIEKEGVKWVPIYTNPMLLIQNEDANFFNPNARARIGADTMYRGLSAIADATYTKGYDFAGQPLSGDAAVEARQTLQYPGTYLFMMQKILNNEGRGTSKYEGSFNVLAEQLYQVSVLKDTLKKLPASELQGSSERAISLRSFKAQAEDFLGFYENKREILGRELKKHLEDTFKNGTAAQKAETLNGWTSLLAFDRWTPGVWNSFGLFSKQEARELLAKVHNPSESPDLQRFYNNARFYLEL